MGEIGGEKAPGEVLTANPYKKHDFFRMGLRKYGSFATVTIHHQFIERAEVLQLIMSTRRQIRTLVRSFSRPFGIEPNDDDEPNRSTHLSPLGLEGQEEIDLVLIHSDPRLHEGRPW